MKQPIALPTPSKTVGKPASTMRVLLTIGGLGIVSFSSASCTRPERYTISQGDVTLKLDTKSGKTWMIRPKEGKAVWVPVVEAAE